MSMNNVFPESMNILKDATPEETIKIMQDYISYMCERIDFYVNNMSKTLNTQNENIAGVRKELTEYINGTEADVGNWRIISDQNGFSIRRK